MEFIENYMYNYPKDNNHLVLNHTIPNIEISKGRDSSNKPKLWVVMFTLEYDVFKIPSKGFKTSEEAYNETLKCYRKYLKNELKRLV